LVAYAIIDDSMKRVVSVSLGSSKRDKSVEIELDGEKVLVERIGTEGNPDLMKEKFRELDGKVDFFSIGGVPLSVHVNGRDYKIPVVKKITSNIKTKIVDGKILKQTIEWKIAEFIEDNSKIMLKGKKGYMPSAVDRWFMADSLEKAGVKMRYGDFASALHMPIYLPSLKWVNFIAPLILSSILKRKDFRDLYPTGARQDEFKESNIKHLNNADIIAGDFLYIKENIPKNPKGKIIITNTTTADDVKELKKRGVSYLITTTPHYDGRSFGTNAMAAALYAVAYGRNKNLDFIIQEFPGVDNYLIKKYAEDFNIKPEIKKLN